MTNVHSRAACRELRNQAKLSRREALEAGWLGTLGLSISSMWAGRAEAAPADQKGAGFGRAKRCIYIFMWGGPSQLDTWDPKPNAPAEVRGEFASIATSTPGTIISEHFPRLAKLSHKYAILRSLTHDDPAHLSSAHHLLTGQYAPKRFSDADPPSPRDWPHIGSVIARLRPGDLSVPSFVSMPWTVSHPAAPGGRAPGQNGGWLGAGFHPLSLADPNTAHFQPNGVKLPPDLSAGRLAERRHLLDQVGSERAAWAEGASAAWRGMTERAFNLVAGAAVRKAFAIEEEPESVRERYGRNTHGQCLLLARRMIEAGVPLVTVNWHDDGQNFWDTHGDNFRQLKNRLMPTADLGFSALIEDLDARGLLDETLLVWVGEFGRRPHIDRQHAGRDHWPRCFSGVLAGGGVQGGMIHGASDRIAAFPSESPISPGDLAATVYHALGIGKDTVLLDPQRVPKHLYAGQTITAVF